MRKEFKPHSSLLGFLIYFGALILIITLILFGGINLFPIGLELWLKPICLNIVNSPVSTTVKASSVMMGPEPLIVFALK